MVKIVRTVFNIDVVMCLSRQTHYFDSKYIDNAWMYVISVW